MQTLVSLGRLKMRFKNGCLLFCFLLCGFFYLLAAQEICQSSTCQHLADDLLNHSMNSSTSPCDDFYEYICGNYNYLQLLNESTTTAETDDQLENGDTTSTTPPTTNKPPNIVISGTMYTRQEMLNEELQQAFTAVQNSSFTSKTLKAVAELYRECTNADSRELQGTEPLVQYIEQLVGGWPMLRRTVNSSNNNNGSSSSITKWQDIFVNVYSKAGLNYIFDIRNELSSVKVRAGWSLSDKLVNPKTKQRYDVYDVAFHRQLKRVIFELTQQLTADDSSSDNLEVHLKHLQDIEQLAHFEWKLVNAYKNSSSSSSSSSSSFSSFSSYHLNSEATLTQTDLREEWISMLNRMQANFEGSFGSQSSRRFRWSTRILSLPKPAYLEKVNAILEETPLEVVQNFFATALALEFGALTTEKFRTIVNGFTTRKKVFNGGGSLSFREECITLLGQFPAAIDRLYVDRHFSLAERAAATVLVEEVRATFKENLKGNRWLDEKTKRNAVKRLDSILPIVGYEEWILDDQQLDEFYREKLEGINVDQLTSKPGGIFNGEYFKLCAHYMLLKEKLEHVDLLALFFEIRSSKAKRKKLTYDISSATVNAYYNKLENSIIIPAGFLKPPFFDQRAPTALNYGSIATIIGHELTHSIDSMGRDSSRSSFSFLSDDNDEEEAEDDDDDNTTNNNNWWTKAAAKSFHAKAQCMVEQYGEVVDESIDLPLDGRRTLMENLSDNSGLKNAYNAFQGHQQRAGRSRLLPGLNFTAEQLFFVSHAKTWCEATSKTVSFLSWIIDNHSPNKYRVNVVMSNFEPFAEAFQCPAGSPMNPLHKCSVW